MRKNLYRKGMLNSQSIMRKNLRFRRVQVYYQLWLPSNIFAVSLWWGRNLRNVQMSGTRRRRLNFANRSWLYQKTNKEKRRLGCQVKVRTDLKIEIPPAIFGIKKWECEVISNRNVATFIKGLSLNYPKANFLISLVADIFK